MKKRFRIVVEFTADIDCKTVDDIRKAIANGEFQRDLTSASKDDKDIITKVTATFREIT